MKKFTLFLLTMMVSLVSFAQLAGGDYVIRHVETGKFLNGSNNWGTKASVTTHAQFMTLAINDGKYSIMSHYSNGGGKEYLAAGDNTFVDAAVAYHTIEAVSGGYSIKDQNGKYLTSNGDVANFNGDEAQVWQFLTKEEYIAEAVALANSGTPADLTGLVPDADFSRNSKDYNLWEGASKMSVGGPNDANGTTARGMNAEKWGGNSKSIDFHTTVTGLPNGKYQVKFQSLYRYNNTDANTNDVAAAAHADGTEVILTNFYANEVQVPFMSIADETAVATYGKMPFSQADASVAFTLGCYQKEFEVEVTDGTLALKVIKNEADHIGCDWSIIDNIELYYLGGAAPAGWDGTVTLNKTSVSSIADLEGLQITFNGAKTVQYLGEEDADIIAFQNANGSEMYAACHPLYGGTITVEGNVATLTGWYDNTEMSPLPTQSTTLYFEDYGSFKVDGKAVYFETASVNFETTAPAEPFALTVSNYRVEGINGGRQEASEYGLATGFQIAAEPALAAGTAVPTLTFNGADQGEATVNAYNYAGAGGAIQFNAAPAAVDGAFSAPGEYTLIVPEGTFVDAEGTPSAAFSSTWVIIQGEDPTPFDVVSIENALNGGTAAGVVDQLSYQWNVTSPVEVKQGTANITLTKDGAPFGGVPTLIEAGTTTYVRFAQHTEGLYTEPGTYELTIPANALVDNDGNGNNEISAVWTIKGQDIDYSAVYTTNVEFLPGENSYLNDKINIAGEEYNAYKIGTAKKAGSCSVVLPVGTSKFVFHAIGWSKTDNTPLKVVGAGIDDEVVAGTGNISGNSPYTFDVENYSPEAPTFTYTFDSPLAEDATVSFSSNYRVVFYGVNAVAEAASFDIVSALNGSNEPETEVEALSYMFTLETANAVTALGEGNITLTDAEGTAVGGSAYVYGYEEGATTVYARFTFDTPDHQLHTPGVYTLNVPAGVLKDANGNGNNEFTASWTVTGSSDINLDGDAATVAIVAKEGYEEEGGKSYAITLDFDVPAGAAIVAGEGYMTIDGSNYPFVCEAVQEGIAPTDGHVSLTFVDYALCDANDPEFLEEAPVRAPGTYTASVELMLGNAEWEQVGTVKFIGSVVLPNPKAVELGTPVFAIGEEGVVTEGYVEANGIVMTLEDSKNITPDMTVKVVADLYQAEPAFGPAEPGQVVQPTYNVVLSDVEFTGDAAFGVPSVAMTDFAQYVLEAGAGNAYMINVKSIEVVSNTGVEASWTFSEEELPVGCAFAVEEEAFAIQDVLNNDNPAGEVDKLLYQFNVILNKESDLTLGEGMVPTLVHGETTYNGVVVPTGENTYAVRFMDQQYYTEEGDYVLTIPAGTFVWADQYENAAYTATWTVVSAPAPETFDITSVVNGNNEPGAVDAISYMFTIETASPVTALGEGVINLTDENGVAVGGNAYVFGYEYAEEGATTVYARFAFDTEDHQLHTPGVYTLNVPAGVLLDAEGNGNDEFHATWTITEGPGKIVIETVEVGTVVDDSWGTNDVYYTATVKFKKPAGAKYAYSEGLHMELNGENTGVPFTFGNWGMIELEEGDDVTLVYKDNMMATTEDPSYEGDLRPAGSYVGTTEITFMDENYLEIMSGEEVLTATFTGSVVLPNLNNVEIGDAAFNIETAIVEGTRVTEGWIEANGIVMTLDNAKNITPDMQIKVVADLYQAIPGFGPAEPGTIPSEFQTLIEGAEFYGDAMFGVPTVAMTEFAQAAIEAGEGSIFQILVKSIEVMDATGVVASYSYDDPEADPVGCAFAIESWIDAVATTNVSEVANEWGDMHYQVSVTVDNSDSDLSLAGVTAAYTEGVKFYVWNEAEETTTEFTFPCDQTEGVQVVDELDIVFTCTDVLFSQSSDPDFEGELRKQGTYDAECEVILVDATGREVGVAKFIGQIVLGVPTAVNGLAADFKVKDVIYTIGGVRVNAPVKGINIINGKKVIK